MSAEPTPEIKIEVDADVKAAALDKEPASVVTPSRRLPMPSLDQLAARVKPQPADTMSPSSTSRPRLATSLLARSSSAATTTTISSLATSGDSLSVQPPSSGRASPVESSRPVSPDGSVRSDDARVIEKLDKLSVADPERVKATRGYKNVPSLEAITQRFSFRGKSSLSTPERERPEPLPQPEPPKANVESTKEHPLQHKWCVFI